MTYTNTYRAYITKAYGFDVLAFDCKLENGEWERSYFFEINSASEHKTLSWFISRLEADHATVEFVDEPEEVR